MPRKKEFKKCFNSWISNCGSWNIFSFLNLGIWLDLKLLRDQAFFFFSANPDLFVKVLQVLKWKTSEMKSELICSCAVGEFKKSDCTADGFKLISNPFPQVTQAVAILKDGRVSDRFRKVQDVEPELTIEIGNITKGFWFLSFADFYTFQEVLLFLQLPTNFVKGRLYYIWLFRHFVAGFSRKACDRCPLPDMLLISSLFRQPAGKMSCFNEFHNCDSFIENKTYLIRSLVTIGVSVRFLLPQKI